MNILITGNAGLIGSQLANYIINNNLATKVVGIDDLSGGYIENVHSDVVFYKYNLLECNLDSIFKQEKIDIVFHLAAYAAEGLSPFIRTYNYDNNLKATVKIVNASIKHNIVRLIFTSSLAVYGHGNNKIFDENQKPCPIDPYGVAKYACEMDIQIAGEQHDLDWCIIRPHNVYGINQNIWDKYRNVLGIWMYQHLNHQKMTIFGDGNQTRAFSYVDDCLPSLFKSAIDIRASKQIINLGGIKSYSINQANQILIEIIKDGDVEYKESRHEVKHSIPTYQKSIDLLDFEHKTDLKDGLEMMWDWAKDQPIRERFVWPTYELNTGIYNFWKNNNE